MAQIENYTVYNDRMRRSMWDKAFFMDKIPGAELIVDYGCADGSLIRFLHSLFPGMYFIGFDIDPAMIAEAEGQKSDGTWFFDSMEAVQAQIAALGVAPEHVAVNFSSVFHEVFHYGYDLSLVRRFLQALHPGYLVVRDMLYHSDDPEAEITPEAEALVRAKIPARQAEDFERCWGSLRKVRNLAHLLLKYKYVENWQRECEENYFAVTLPALMDVLNPENQFRPILTHRYLLPWCRHEMAQLGLDPGDAFTTHMAMILARRPETPLVPIAHEGR